MDDLKWIDVRDTLGEKPKKRSLSTYLVPLGCAVTIGVLVNGVYHMFKRDSKKQQILMRYRILAQGVTIAIALCSMTGFRKSV